MKAYQELCQAAESVIEQRREEMIACSEDIAAHPELGGEEYRTSKKLADMLTADGWQVEMPFAGWETGFRAVFPAADDKPRAKKVALLTEYDALPVMGHACGHCLSAGISMLAGMALRDLQDELDLDVHIIGTPAEENLGAKATMADDGIFDDYAMAIMIHMFDRNWVSPYLLAMDNAIYTFHGKAAHAANAPWDGINALDAAQLFFHAVDMLRQQVRPEVRLHGVIHEGGQAANVIPDLAKCEFYWRCPHQKDLPYLEKRMDDCIKGAALATGCTYEKHKPQHSYYDLKKNATGIEAITEVFEELGLPLTSRTQEPFASSDVGNVSYHCPTFQPTIKMVDQGVALHTPEMEAAVHTDRGHQAMIDGAKVIARSCIKIFSNPVRIKHLAEDFKATLDSAHSGATGFEK